MYETELSKYNRKTLNFNKFKAYLKEKNRINNILCDFYNKYIFRKLKLNRYLNRRKSEQVMIDKFKNKFGNNKDVIICVGDFEQRKHMKFKPPTKGIGIRKIFKQAGYKLFLIDEFRTSCKCSNCHGGECKKFLASNNGFGLCHTLLRCKNGCGVWDRDRNGAKNIHHIAYNIISGKNRPEYLSRIKLNCHVSPHDDPKFTCCKRQP